MDEPLQFVPFTSEIELPFYSALFSSKLEYDKLDDSARGIVGVYEARDVEPDASCKLQILGSALTNTEWVGSSAREASRWS
jgi:ubiquitin-like modifier-activating enzyme ATG7